MRYCGTIAIDIATDGFAKLPVVVSVVVDVEVIVVVVVVVVDVEVVVVVVVITELIKKSYKGFLPK